MQPARAGTTTAAANERTNRGAPAERREWWTPARDALWRSLDPHLQPGASVAVVGAGNGDDLPLRRIVERARAVDLYDIDPTATARAIAHLPTELRARCTAHVVDVTGGAADTVLAAVRRRGVLPDTLVVDASPLRPGTRHDLVVGDLLYSQLLYPGLAALGLRGRELLRLLRRFDPQLTRALVQRLHASCADDGIVAHVYDVACWSPHHPQPAPIERVLRDPWNEVGQLVRADHSDPRLPLGELGAELVATDHWRWPLAPGKDYLVRCTLARGPLARPAG